MSTPGEFSVNQFHKPSDRLISVVTDWFLDFLSVPSPEFFWQTLEKQDKGLSDRLCQDLTAAPYIDYLRDRIGEEQFQRIEKIAERGLEGETVQKYPYSIILLLGLSRKHLSKDTALYKLGSTSYQYYRDLSLNHGGDSRAREVMLETGIQLYRREKEIEQEGEIWQYLQLEFKYSDELFERRKQFYQTENPRELYKLTTERWLLLPESSPKYNKLTRQGLFDYGVLHPQLLDLPVDYGSADALRIVEEFSKVLRSGEDQKSLLERLNSEELAKHLRIMQWDIFTRDLFTEQVEHKLSYQSSLEESGISGLPPSEFLSNIVEASWRAHCHYFPVHSGVLRKRDEATGNECRLDNVTTGMQQFRVAFRFLLNQATKYNPSSYDDVIAAFADPQNRRSISKALLIEDGELTFFVLLWLLRQSTAAGAPPDVWLTDPKAELPVAFLPEAEKVGFNSWWSKENLASLAQKCGLLVMSHREGYYILTRRWRSLLKWLERQQRMVIESASGNEQGDDEGIEINEALPVKKIVPAKTKGTHERQFVLALEKFFTANKELEDFLAHPQVFPDEVTIEEFGRNCIGPLIKFTSPLLLVPSNSPSDEANEPWPRRDITIFRLCRAGFLPLEYLFRAYQPYELHLLTLAMSFTKTELFEQKSAPISLAFASVAGSLPPHVPGGMFVNLKDAETGNLTQGEKDRVSARTKARQWLAPYWTLFTALSAELSVGKVQRASTQIGRQVGVDEILSAFSHEVGKISDYIFRRFFIRMGDMFWIEGSTEATGGAAGAEDEEGWKERAGEVKPHNSAPSEISEWRVCPTPFTLRTLRDLYAVWLGSKVVLTDFGVNPNDYLTELIEKICPMAREMAVARFRAEQMNPIKSLRGAQRTEETTRLKILHAADIKKPEFTPPAEGLKLNTTGTDTTDTFQKVFLVRALLAALSNAVRYTDKNRQVTVKVRMDDDWVLIEIENPSAVPLHGSPNRTAGQLYQESIQVKSRFSLGTEAVMNTCAKRLDGKAFMGPVDEEGTLFRSTITFPLPSSEKEDETPWLTLDLKQSLSS